MRIKLSNTRRTAVVDSGDYEYLSQWKWMLSPSGYAFHWSPRNHYKRHAVHMHREIMRTPTYLQCDHINGNKLDNRRENLRNCTEAENRRNKRMQSNNTSGYIGSFWHKRTKKWRAQITLYGQAIHIAYFNNRYDAAQAYASVAQELFGEFYRTL